MNIIEAVKTIIADYEHISDFSGGISIDFTKETSGNIGIFPTGDRLVKKDILGNETRQHNFQLTATAASFSEFDRLNNSNWHLEFSYYLNGIKNVVIEENDEEKITITSITPANAMLYGYLSTDAQDGIVYQLQISAEYKKERKNLWHR